MDPWRRSTFIPTICRTSGSGITASRKVGNSVVRHRLKRRVREIFRRFKGRDRLMPIDVVVHLKPAAARADFAGITAELERLLGSLLLRQESRR